MLLLKVFNLQRVLSSWVDVLQLPERYSVPDFYADTYLFHYCFPQLHSEEIYRVPRQTSGHEDSEPVDDANLLNGLLHSAYEYRLYGLALWCQL